MQNNRFSPVGILTLSGPLIERTEMKRKIYLSEAWILLWIRLKSPDVGPERVNQEKLSVY